MALGITTSVLPAATAAASGPTPDSDGSLAYATGSGPLLYWEPFDTTLASGDNLAYRGSTGIDATGRHARWGDRFTTSTVTAVDGDEGVLSAWSMENEGGLDGLVTDSRFLDEYSYGVRWELDNTSSTATVELASLVLYRARNAGTTSGPLRLAFYSSELLRTVELDHDITRHIVIPLGNQSVAPGGTFRVVAYPYATETVRELQLIRYDSTIGNVDGTLVPLDPVADAIQTDVIARSIEANAYTAAFIGRVLAP